MLVNVFIFFHHVSFGCSNDGVLAKASLLRSEKGSAKPDMQCGLLFTETSERFR